MIWNFFNPIQKNWNQKKKQILLHLIRQTIQFIQQKPFLQINRKKTFLLLKKQDRKSHKKKTTEKKTMIVFHHIIEKKSSNE